ncbi:TIGR00374 family protein [Brumimicrobium salinarum]|uniref:TIGR00374 family protein n=1 Tax=Brumimicrobium salinarum TaxID=2058658 RepID=A0A2I0R4T2_9FLAO|nr:lysylphosphatidylglycerol synthase transmembrane domain-containing protein [Brumimicrobium salinarum]PKR81390.1 TIGR00374 family protein [Brumimicrobium salinarum]
MGKKINKKVINVIKIVFPLLIGVYLTWHFYNAMDTSTRAIFFKAIREANYFWIFLSMFLGFLSHLIRAYRWKFMLEPIGYRPKFWHRYHAMMVGYLVNLLVPRAGEITRPALLYQTDKIPFSKSFGTIIAERVFDLFMLVIIFLATLFLSFEELVEIKNIIVSGAPEGGSEGADWIFQLLISLFIGGVLLFAVLWVKLDKFRKKVTDFVKDMLNGVFSIFKSKNPFLFIFSTIMVWVLYILFFGICFKAFEQTENFPINGILIGFIAGTFGLMFTNGGIGAYPYLVGIVVIFFIGSDFDNPLAAEGVGKALGMIIWLSQTVMMIVLGLLSLVLLPRNYKKEKDEKMAENQK